MGSPFVSDPSLGTLVVKGITTPTLLPGTGNGPCFLATVAVTVAGSGAGSVNDAATIPAANPSNAVLALPSALGIYPVRGKCDAGIVVAPGTGQTVTVWYSV